MFLREFVGESNFATYKLSQADGLVLALSIIGKLKVTREMSWDTILERFDKVRGNIYFDPRYEDPNDCRYEGRHESVFKAIEVTIEVFEYLNKTHLVEAFEAMYMSPERFSMQNLDCLWGDHYNEI